jgi:glycosyltransferase involved in cell wall biosynthesis
MISVIIASYNRAHLIRRAIGSVLSQSFDDYEIVVADDGSIDNTEEVIAAYSDEKIRYIRLKENGGAGKAKNIAAAEAKGEFLTFLDSDDYYYDDTVLEAINHAGREADVVSYRHYYIETGGERVKDTALITGDPYRYLMEHPLHYIGKPPYAIRKEVFIGAGGFNESIRWGEAVGLWRRIFRRGAVLKIVDGIGYVMCNHDGERVSRGNEKIDRRKGKRVVFDVIKSVFEEQADYFKSRKVIKAVWLILLLRISKSMRDFKRFYRISGQVMANGLAAHFKAYYLLKRKKITEG